MKYFVSVIIICLTASLSSAQILCINCYRQNPPVSANITNLVLNGGFENTTCIPNNWRVSSYCPNSTYYDCSIDNWTCTGGGTDTYADIWDTTYFMVAEGANACYMGNWYCSACPGAPGDTSCFINQPGCSVTGFPPGYPQNDLIYGGTQGISVEQPVSGLIAGHVYVLEFWAGGESGFTEDGVFAVDLGFGNTFLRNPPTDAFSGIGMRFVIQFLATSSTHTIKFTNWGHVCSSCTELALDDVRLYPIKQLSSIIPACAVGIQQADLTGDIRINQNEVLHQIEIRPAKTGNYRVVLYNITGGEVMSEKFSESVNLDTRLLKTGIYMCEVSGNSVKQESKIVIR